jgi:hypothetical protein
MRTTDLRDARGSTRTCAHCGQVCGDYAGGAAGVYVNGELRNVCHPNDASRPDCYRRITVYHEPAGALIGVEVKPAGVSGPKSNP